MGAAWWQSRTITLMGNDCPVIAHTMAYEAEVSMDSSLAQKVE
jgi:hypothetical protein